MQEFKILKEELVFQGTILDFYCHDVQLANGNVAKWDAIHHNGAAAMIAVKDNGKIIFERQFRGAIGRTILEIPAGCKDSPEEDMAVCAARELEEETGYKPLSVHHLFDYLSAPAYTTECVGIYYSEELVPGKQNWDEDEYIQMEEYTVEEAISLIENGVITDGKTIAAIYAYKNLKNK